MARVSQRRIRRLLQIGENGPTTTEQGQALEELVCYLFEKIPGITVTKRNRLNVFSTEEIDVAFWNDRHPRGVFFLPDIILVECKNWSTPVGSAEVSWFDTKLRHRGLTFGVLVATKGITGNPTSRTNAHSIIAAGLCEQRRMVVITRSEIEALRDTSQLARLIKEKLCELAVAGTILA